MRRLVAIVCGGAGKREGARRERWPRPATGTRWKQKAEFQLQSRASQSVPAPGPNAFGNAWLRLQRGAQLSYRHLIPPLPNAGHRLLRTRTCLPPSSRPCSGALPAQPPPAEEIGLDVGENLLCTKGSAIPPTPEKSLLGTLAGETETAAATACSPPHSRAHTRVHARSIAACTQSRTPSEGVTVTLSFSPARQQPVFDQYFPQQPLPCDKCTYGEEEQINLLVQMAAPAWEKRWLNSAGKRGKGRSQDSCKTDHTRQHLGSINENQPR